jgi:hypothetical protein
MQMKLVSVGQLREFNHSTQFTNQVQTNAAWGSLHK